MITGFFESTGRDSEIAIYFRGNVLRAFDPHSQENPDQWPVVVDVEADYSRFAFFESFTNIGGCRP